MLSATVALTLTIGVGSAAAIFAVVNAVLLRPLPYGHPDRLVGAWHDLPPVSKTHGLQTAGTYFTYKKFARSIEGIALYDDGSASISDPDGRADPERMLIARTTGNLIPLLEVSPLIGRSFSEADDAPKGPPVVLISEDLWRARFGADKNAIGNGCSSTERPPRSSASCRRAFAFRAPERASGCRTSSTRTTRRPAGSTTTRLLGPA